MDTHKFAIMIPFEIGDIVQADNFDNKYKILDILTVQSAKHQVVNVILKLLDIVDNVELNLNFSDFNWKIVKEEDMED